MKKVSEWIFRGDGCELPQDRDPEAHHPPNSVFHPLCIVQGAQGRDCRLEAHLQSDTISILPNPGDFKRVANTVQYGGSFFREEMKALLGTKWSLPLYSTNCW
ncbi:hypothetical protein D3C75_481340 [compost metagenome]